MTLISVISASSAISGVWYIFNSFTKLAIWKLMTQISVISTSSAISGIFYSLILKK